MAFLKTANASEIRLYSSTRHFEEAWSRTRTASAQTQVNDNLIQQASEILQQNFHPNNFLLTHATIVASVDTVDAEGEVGKVANGHFTINRKYSNYRVKAESEPWINNNCFVPGTLVTMSDGTLKPIEDIEEGDIVLSHTGDARRVSRTFKHHVDQDLYVVQPHGTMEKTCVTSEHPLFVFRSNTECVHCGGGIARSVHAISHLLGKHYCSSACYYRKKVANAELLSEKEGEFVAVGDLQPTDFTSHPVVSGVERCSLTPGKARLIGLFLAEGHYELYSQGGNERVGVMWAYHADERETLAKTTVDLLKSEFGVEAVVREKSGNTISVTTKTNREMVDFFSSFVLGEGSKTKVLHASLLKASPTIQIEILRGWFEGDGTLVQTDSDIRLSGCSASRSLVNQIQIILRRFGVSSRLGVVNSLARKRVVREDGAVEIVSDPSRVLESWTATLGGCYLSDIVQDTVYEAGFYDYVEANGGIQKAPELRFLNGYELRKLGAVGREAYSGYVHNIEVAYDNSYIANGLAVHNCDAWERQLLLGTYRTFIGSENYVEHVQIPEQSKGKIIDAVARDLGDSVYIDILVATRRKHAKLIAEIESGKMNSMSMGCHIAFSQCTKCGHVAADETEMCNCVKYEKGNKFYTDSGSMHRVAELCGHHSDLESNLFMEASWVAVPAFQGAVLRNILSPIEISSNAIKQAQEILSQPPKQWSSDEMDTYAKAAHFLARSSAFDFGDEEEDGEEVSGGGGDGNIIDDLEEAVVKSVKTKVKQQIQDKMNPKVEVENDKTTLEDDNIVNASSIYKASLNAMVRSASCDAALINGVAEIDTAFGIQVPVEIYQASLKVGSKRNYKSLGRFIQACGKKLGRKPTRDELKDLIRLSNLLALQSG